MSFWIRECSGFFKGLESVFDGGGNKGRLRLIWGFWSFWPSKASGSVSVRVQARCSVWDDLDGGRLRRLGKDVG